MATIQYSSSAIGNFSYTWDANHNKTSETISGVMSGYGFTATYDDEDRLLTWDRADSNLEQSWNLSAVGNWNSVTQNATTQSRTHSPANEILTAASQNVQHDPKGNATLLPSSLWPSGTSLAMKWDFNNKLRAADINNDATDDVFYLWDALGRRVGRTASGVTTIYVQNGQQTVADYSSGTLPSSPGYTYLWGDYIDELVLRTASAGNLYFHRNQQYSVTAVTTSAGAITERYAYSPYGELTILNSTAAPIASSVIDNRYTYTGREWDSVLKLYHFRARMMSPVAGRFLGRDPIGYLDGVNCYRARFVPNNKDPMGLWAWTNSKGDYCGPYVQLYTGSWCVPPNVWYAAMQGAANFLNCWADCESETHENITTYVAGVVTSTTGWVNIERVRWVAKTAEEIKKGSAVGPQQTHTSILSRLANWMKSKGYKDAGKVLRYHQRFTKTAPAASIARTCLVGVVITETAISLHCSWKCS